VPEGRGGKILFIDARNLGHLINRRTKELSPEDIQQIAETYHNWRNSPPREEVKDGQFPSSGGVAEGRGGDHPLPPPKEGNYENIAGFCASVSISKVKELDYVLTPGRYVGLPDDEDDFDFNERFTALKAELEEQLKEEVRLNEIISTNLSKIKVNG